MMKKNTTRQLILEAVIACIEKFGVDKVTTRKIAQEAGTNIASINYYFSSKDDLIQEALGMALQHMYEDLMEILDDAHKPFQQALQEFLTYLLVGGNRFPGMVMAHLYPAVVEKRTDTPGEIVFSKVFERLVTRAAHDFPDKNVVELRNSLDYCMSVVMFKMLAPSFFNPKVLTQNDLMIDSLVAIFNKNLQA